MQSMSDLNSFGNQGIDVTDDRDAQLIYTGPAGDAEFTTSEGLRIYFKDALGVEVEDIVDYANLGMEVEIELISPYPAGPTIGYDNKPSYITVSSAGVTTTITGFRSIGDWLWLKNNLYIQNDFEWFGVFDYDVTVSNDVSSPDTTFTSTITVLEIDLFDAPADYDYAYTSSGFTTYPGFTVKNDDSSETDVYKTVIEVTGTYKNKLVDAKTTSTSGTYTWDNGTKKLTLNATGTQNMQDMIDNIQFDFNGTQYPHEFLIFIQNVTVNPVGKDYETQDLESTDDTILTEGTSISHDGTNAVTLGANTPKFNAGLTGSGELIADISPYDGSTITDIDGPTIPIVDFGQTVIDSSSLKQGTADILAISTQGTRMLHTFSDNAGDRYFSVYDWDSTNMFVETYDVTANLDSLFELQYDHIEMSQDGNTIVWVEAIPDSGNSDIALTQKLSVAKYSGGSWTTNKQVVVLDAAPGAGGTLFNRRPEDFKYVSNDGNIVAIKDGFDPREIYWYQWNSGTSSWDDYDIAGTRFAYNQGNDIVNLHNPYYGLAEYANDGNMFVVLAGDSSNVDQLIVYRYENNAWNDYVIDTQGDGSSIPDGSRLNTPYVSVSENGEFISAWWEHDEDTTSDHYVWHYENGSYTVYKLGTFTMNGDQTVSTTDGQGNVESLVCNNGDVLQLLRDYSTDANVNTYDMKLFLYPFLEGVGYNEDDRLEITIDQDAFDRNLVTGSGQNKIAWVPAGGIVFLNEQTIDSADGPPYTIRLNAVAKQSELSSQDSRIVITADTLSNMNAFLEDVEVTPAGSDDIDLVFKVTAPDGSTTEKIYTIGGP